jgi:hypothetical protein
LTVREGIVGRQPGLETRDALRFARVVSWLDSARWNKAVDLIDNPFYETLEATDKILVHWLCYVTDRQRPFRQVWEDGGFVFSSIVGAYSVGRGSSLNVREFLQERQKERKGRLPAYYARYGDKDVAYAPRYGADEKSIERTLDILRDYDSSLVAFLSHFISWFRGQRQGLKRLAHSLDLLSYRLEVPIDEARSLLGSEDGLERHFQAWSKRSAIGHKRLWAGLRDYRKPGSPFRRYFEADVKWPENGFELDQLELPGDVWNERFSGSLVTPIASLLGLRITRATSSQTARQLYEGIVNLDPHTHFYPERLDFSFDFAPRMCDLRMCDVCLFAEPAETLCLGALGEEDGKLCPVVLLCCGYRYPCRVADCPVVDGTSYGLCGRHTVNTPCSSTRPAD